MQESFHVRTAASQNLIRVVTCLSLACTPCFLILSSADGSNSCHLEEQKQHTVSFYDRLRLSPLARQRGQSALTSDATVPLWMQDFKLNVVRWHLLPSLGKLLFSLAQMLSAPDYKEHYRRDLGPTALQASSQGRPAFLLLAAFAMHPSLLRMSTGVSCRQRLCWSFHHA